MSERLGVIGGGVAGLAAAWRLASAGRSVIVYEAAPVTGGLLSSVSRGAVTADTAVQLLGSTYTETRRLAAAAEAADLLVRVPGRDAAWRRGRAHAITYGSVSSMLASGALPTLLKLRLAGKYVPFLGTRASHVDANDLAGTAVAHDRESIDAWGRRELGDDFVEYLVYPLLGAYYGTLPERTSAGLYHALARVGMDVHLYAVRGGAARLAEALTAALVRAGVAVRTGTPVHGLHASPDGIQVHTDAGEDRLAGVVIATPPGAARSLLGESSVVGQWLSALRTAPAVTLTLWLERPVPVEWFGISFPRTEPPGELLVAACVQSRKPGMVERGGDAVVLYPAPAWLATRAHDSAASLRAALVPALERALPGLERVIEEVSVHRHGGGYRLFEPGHLRRLAGFDATMLPARCTLAGDYLVAPTVEGAVRSGLAAAARLLS